MTPIQKLEAEYVNWDRLPDWVQWVTASRGGTIIGWRNPPQGHEGFGAWWDGDKECPHPIAFRYDMKGINWRDCKWQRPHTNTQN